MSQWWTQFFWSNPY